MRKHLLSILIIIFIICIVGWKFVLNNKSSEIIDLANLQKPCMIDRECGGLVGVDCNSAADGPYYYVDKSSGRIVKYCGGVCMGSHGEPNGKYCRNCPPKEWNCKD